MPTEILGPTSHFFVSQRLRLHYVDWGNRAAPPLVLVHGGRDHARSWDWLAEELRRDHHVMAPDLRGHGDSAWAIGSLYHIAEYVIDLAQLLDSIGGERVTLVAHSLGSMICALYAGAHPERVEKLVAIEGIDPPRGLLERFAELSPRERVARGIAEAQQQAGRSPRRYESIEAAARRMRASGRGRSCPAIARCRLSATRTTSARSARRASRGSASRRSTSTRSTSRTPPTPTPIPWARSSSSRPRARCATSVSRT